VIKGRQAHGSAPWEGVDPIVVSAQVINALQTVVSRQVDITHVPAVLTVGAIKGGIRHNIIPDSVEMIGTIRTFDKNQREQLIARATRIVENTAAAAGATATFEIAPGSNPVVINDPELLERMLPTFQRVAGKDRVKQLSLITGAEDFAFFANTVPSVFFFLGITPPDQDPAKAPSHHSDLFYVDEGSIPVGLRAMVSVALDYLAASGPS
jgi:amidohydrolase